MSKYPEADYILFTGANTFLPEGRCGPLTFEEAMAFAGGNTGNLLIGHGVRAAIRSKLPSQNFIFERMSNGDFTRANAGYINDKYKLVVFGGANFINPKINMGSFYHIVNKLNIPIAMFGVGAQADGPNEILEIPEGTLKFLNAVAERTPKIGVRGEYTRKTLQTLGFENVKVTGCSSYYCADVELVAKKWESLVLDGTEKFGFSTSRSLVNSKYRDEMRIFDCRLLAESLTGRGKCIVQACYAEASVSYNHDGTDALVQNFCDYFNILDAKVGADFLLNSTYIFHEFEPWIRQLRQFDFFIGSRIHGAIMSLIAGVPTVLLAHDTRTQEMAEHFGISTITPEQAKSLASPEEIIKTFDLPKLIERNKASTIDFNDFIDEVVKF